MATAINIQLFGNSLVVEFNDGGHVLCYGDGNDFFFPKSNSYSIRKLQRFGNQISILFNSGTKVLAYVTANNGFYLVKASSPNWRWPLDEEFPLHVSSEFGGGHSGIDVTSSPSSLINGLGIYAIADGSTVLDKGFTAANGNIIKLQAPDGTQYGFYHMSAPTTLNISDSVNAGGNVGYVGNTGSNATGYHMHFGTSETGWVGLSMVFANMVNPRDYMSARGVPYPW